MARKKKLCRDRRGLFVRNIGWKKTTSGYTQQKFYLGRDEQAAKIAALKLEQLWDAVRRRWEWNTLPVARLSNEDHSADGIKHLTATDKASGGLTVVTTVGTPKMDFVREDRPVWESVSLTIAEAIRNHETVARVPMPDKLAGVGLRDPAIGQWLSRLRDDVPSIRIELLDEVLQRQATSEIKEVAKELIESGRRMIRGRSGGETMHMALRDYKAAIEKKHVNLEGRTNSTGTNQARQIDFLIETLDDVHLADLSTPKIHEYQELLARRPKGKRVARIAVRTARNMIKQLRHFIRWLVSAPGYTWKHPGDFEFSPIKIIETVEEKASLARTSRVQTFSLEEIEVLWQYASPLKRLLMLLGLNCGFDAKMIATLQRQDVFLRQTHPHQCELRIETLDTDSWITRLRNKTSVYGEWKLWPIATQAIEWWLRQRETIEVAQGVSAMIVNRSGNPYDSMTAKSDRNGQIPGLWNGLLCSALAEVRQVAC